MARFLIVYGTKQGQSAKIASALGEELRRIGHQTQIWDAAAAHYLKITDYDAFLLGGGVHVSGYPSPLRQWAASHAQELSTKPGAFFSVCLGILQKDPKVQEDERRIVQSFFKKTGWTPSTFAIFPGALPYSKYNWFLKRAMRWMARKAGVETDIRRDYEYTDWEEVRRFAREFAKRITANGSSAA